MESKNQTTCIVLAVIAVLACTCIATSALVALGMARIVPQVARNVSYAPYEALTGESAQLGRTFEVGEAPELEVQNFAGDVVVQPGEDGTIGVEITKRVTNPADLDRIEVEVSQQGDAILIKARNPRRLNNTATRIEVTVPVLTRLKLHTGAGGIDVRGIQNSIDANTGAGTVDVRQASGRARLNTGAGSILYEGTPLGDCAFRTGAGSIELRVPGDLDMQINLHTGLGSVDVDHDVQGRVRAGSARGTVGSGDKGSIEAFTGAGSIEMRRSR